MSGKKPYVKQPGRKAQISLGKKQQGKKGIPASMAIVQQNWASLPEACRDAFKAAGINFDEAEEEPSLIEMLKPHLATLPETVRQHVEREAGVPAPKEVDLTKKLKVAVGQIRDLSARKTALQGKADQAKTTYKALLEELKGVTDAIEKSQKELSEVSKEYGTLLAASPVEDASSPKHNTKPAEAMEIEPIEEYQNMLAEVGIMPTDEQKTRMETKWIEQQKKKRRLGPPGKHYG